MSQPFRPVASAFSQPITLRKGRGAASQLEHRFTRTHSEAFDDGWEVEADSIPLTTTVRFEQVKTALTQNTSPDLPFQLGLNPYRGCEHGCIYCYARPTHSYLGLSPGLDFESQLIAKRNVAEVLRRELASPQHRAQTITLGSVTDCYQPVERELGLTREVLEVLSQARHPFAIVTKGSGVERDVDLLAHMAAQKLAAVHVTLTTLQPELARLLEPRAAAPHRRLRMIRRLADAGIPVGVSLAPQIPFLNDDMEQTMAAAYEAGARYAFYAVLRLPWEVAPLFQEWLQVHYPDRAQRVLERVRDMHGIDQAERAAGKVYNSQHGQRMKGAGPWADMLAQRFAVACRKLGFNRERLQLDCSAYRASLLGAQQELF